jgi:NhaP-type Na+/H+ or K+/H+ antiporter
MTWDHLSVNRPHLVYIILGGFTSLFMLCSSFIKERLYIGEATVATICGVIFGPHAANLINPLTWGNTDQITLEFSRIVLVVQCFAVGVELPKYYMEKHWRSVVFLLIPVMTFGWLITSLFIWWMVPPLNWLESLCCAACVTATDPVLASSVVGKGKFAKRVPKHLRDILSAESGCNDGMAFPFIYLALYLIDYRPHASEVAFNWIVITILYECVFGAFYGFVIGYIGRHGIKYAERHDLVDRESFLVFYFVLALFCAGSGSILGVDDLLVGFAAGVGFSNDGWFTQKTEESHVSNVIDLLLNLAYFVYLGTIIPWEQYNNPALGLTPWRLVVIAIFVILFRRIPVMMALKPLIPDVKTWREALFAGHFGPIGVGAIFVAILARAELETETTTPLASYPDPSEKNYTLVALIWPITTFLVIASIIVHGSSIAVFTLGKHINTLTLTMSYTTGGDDGPGWLNRLPRISSTSRSQAKSAQSETDVEDLKPEDFPPGMLPPIGMPKEFLRRQKEEDNPSRAGSRPSSLIPRRRKKVWDDGLGPGGPISRSAIYPQGRNQSEQTSETLTPSGSPENIRESGDERNETGLGEVQNDPEMHEILHRDSEDEKRPQHKSDAERHPNQTEVYQEGDDIIVENEDGDVLETKESSGQEKAAPKTKTTKEEADHSDFGYKNLRKKLGIWRHKDEPEDEDGEKRAHKGPQRKRGPALAYQFGNTIIVEDEDGEVVKTYELPANKAASKQGEPSTSGGANDAKPSEATSKSGISATQGESSAAGVVRQGLQRMGTWGFAGKNINPESGSKNQDDDDRHIRFTIGGAGRRLTKEDFLKEIQSLDPKARSEIISASDAPPAMKDLARKDASKTTPGTNRLYGAKAPQVASHTAAAVGIGKEMAVRRGGTVNVAENLSEDSEGEDTENERLQRIQKKGGLDLSRKKDAPLHQPASSSTTHLGDQGNLPPKGKEENKP